MNSSSNIFLIDTSLNHLDIEIFHDCVYIKISTNFLLRRNLSQIVRLPVILQCALAWKPIWRILLFNSLIRSRMFYCHLSAVRVFTILPKFCCLMVATLFVSLPTNVSRLNIACTMVYYYFLSNRQFSFGHPNAAQQWIWHNIVQWNIQRKVKLFSRPKLCQWIYKRVILLSNSDDSWMYPPGAT